MSSGRAISKALEFIDHPKNIIDSVRKASAFSFGIDAISARSIGSSWPAFGRNWRWRAIGKHCSALFTMSWFSSESNTIPNPSSMYPSTPPL